MATTPLVVVGYKNSDHSRHALDTAIGLARPMGALVRVVHVVEAGATRSTPTRRTGRSLDG